MTLAQTLETLWHMHAEMVTEGEADQALHAAYPAWRLALDGVVTAGNLLALWLWEGTQNMDANAATPPVIGSNVFNIFAANLGRIPPAKNNDFWRAKFKSEYVLFGDSPTAPLAEARRKNPELQQIYDQIDKDIPLGNFWEYMLRIVPPQKSRNADLLEFNTLVSRVAENDKPSGYVAVFTPLGKTREIMFTKYDELYVRHDEKREGASEIREQHPYRGATWDPTAEAKGRKLHTMVFDNEEEYVRFTDYVEEQFDGAGLELTDVPIIASIRVRSWLLERTQALFAMRPVTGQDIAKVGERLKGRRPFDPRNLDDFHVPGVPRRDEPN